MFGYSKTFWSETRAAAFGQADYIVRWNLWN